MSTDDYLAIFSNKKLLPLDMMESYFFDYLKALSESVMSSTFRAAGVFDSQVVVSSDAPSEVSVAGAFDATDNDGRKLSFNALDARLQDVPFENTNAVAYNIGLRQVELVDELDINPRTGQPEYRRKQENVGTLGTPDIVTDNGTTITLRVDAVTESGVSHAGRTVRVYLVTPEAVSWANAYEDLTVTWTGSNNEVTSTGLLGQTVGLVSEVEAEYAVVEIGPVLVRVATEDLKTAAGVCFLAEFDGVSASTVVPDMTDQNVLSGSLSDLSEITRTGTNGDLKVSVRADALDSDEDQLRAENSSGVKQWSVTEEGKLWLPNAGEYFPLDDASPYGAAGTIFNGESFLGYVNQNLVTVGKTVGPSVIDGFGINSSGAGSITLASGTAFALGDGDGGFINIGSAAVTVADGSFYLYVDPTSTTVQVTATKATAFGVGMVPLHYVLMAAGSISDTLDLRLFATNSDKRGIVTVGNSKGTANFDDLKAALSYVSEARDQDSGRYPGMTIRVMDDIDVGSAAVEIGADLSGITIEGNAWRGDSDARTKIGFDVASNSDKACFLLGADNVRFVGIEFVIADTPTGGDGTCAVLQNTAGAAVVGTRFDGCKFTDSDGTLAFAVRGHSNRNWDDVTFVDCLFDLDSATASDVAICDYGGANWFFSRCKFAGDDTLSVLCSESNALTGAVFDACDFSDFLRTNLASNAASPTVVVTFRNCTGSLGDIPNGILTDCVFTSTKFNDDSASDFVSVTGCVITGAETIEKDFSASVFRFTDSFFNVEPGAYFIKGTNPDQVVMRGCNAVATGTGLTSVAITLNDNCELTDTNIGIMVVTFTGLALIAVVGDNNRISGCRLNGTKCQAAIYLNASTYTKVHNNFITVPGSSGEGVIGIWANGTFDTITDNQFHQVGTGIATGVGVYLASGRNTVVGNYFATIEGAGVYAASGVTLATICSNHFENTGSATSNPWLGAVSDDAVEMYGDNNIISNNMVHTHVAQGIVIYSGASDNVVNGNHVSSTGGTYGIDIKTGAVNTICQLNNTDNGVNDSGTTSVVTGGGNI